MKKIVKVVIGVAAAAVVVIAGVVIALEISIKKSTDSAITVIGGADGPTSVFLAGKIPGGEKEVAEYTSMKMEEAKVLFEVPGEYVILDVRTAEEYGEGHIPGAINVANEDIQDEAPAELSDKEQLIYVYCRSGRRSKEASAKLAALGYTNIVEIGGIIDWDGEID